MPGPSGDEGGNPYCYYHLTQRARTINIRKKAWPTSAACTVVQQFPPAFSERKRNFFLFFFAPTDFSIATVAATLRFSTPETVSGAVCPFLPCSSCYADSPVAILYLPGQHEPGACVCVVQRVSCPRRFRATTKIVDVRLDEIRTTRVSYGLFGRCKRWHFFSIQLALDGVLFRLHGIGHGSLTRFVWRIFVFLAVFTIRSAIANVHLQLLRMSCLPKPFIFVAYSPSYLWADILRD